MSLNYFTSYRNGMIEVSSSPVKRILFKIYYYLTRGLIFPFIFLRVLWYGLGHPSHMFNFLYGVVTEIAEFHKRTGGRLVNFKSSQLYKQLLKELTLPRSNCFHSQMENIRPIEAQVMATLVTHLRPKTIFEMGTYNGFSTMHLLKNAPEDAVIYTLDLPPDRSSLNLHSELREAHKDLKNIELNKSRLFSFDSDRARIRELFGDSMHFDFSPYLGKIDLVFIDASHSYSYVKSDSEHAFQMLTARGIILWHDYDFIHPSIYKLVNELALHKKIYYIERTRFALYVRKEA